MKPRTFLIIMNSIVYFAVKIFGGQRLLFLEILGGLMFMSSIIILLVEIHEYVTRRYLSLYFWPLITLFLGNIFCFTGSVVVVSAVNDILVAFTYNWLVLGLLLVFIGVSLFDFRKHILSIGITAIASKVLYNGVILSMNWFAEIFHKIVTN